MTKEDLKNKETDVNEEEINEEEKTYTQEELDSLLQSETDRRITSAQKKWQEDYEAKLEKERSEAEKLASMSAEERARAEFEKEKSEWEKQRAEFERERMKLEATKLLNAESLPIELVDYVVGDTAEDVKTNIETLKGSWETALEQAVSEKMRGRAPAGSGLQNKEVMKMSKDEFSKLPYKERATMLKADPDILNKLKD